jgi:hypothetical protein
MTARNNLIKFLHIGDYKTGTTWLQQNIFRSNSKIKLIGEGEDEVGIQLWAALENLIYADKIDIDKWRQEFFELIYRYEDSDKTIYGISRESLISGNPFHFHDWKRSAERLHSAFGPIKIIITFREQSSLLTSLYSTFVKNGGIMTIEDLYLDSKQFKAFLDRLDYHQIAAYYQKIFHINNCLFLTFNELCTDQNSYIQKIYNFIGVVPPLLKVIDSISTPNKSLTEGALKFHRIMNRGVRSVFNKKDTQSLIEQVIIKIIRIFGNSKYKLQSRRNNYLWPEVKLHTGANYSIENVRYISGIRIVSEHITCGKKIKLPIKVKKALNNHIKLSNNKLKNDFAIDLS